MHDLYIFTWPGKQLRGVCLRCKSTTAGRGQELKRMYEVVRQDDNANTFVIASGLDLAEAQEVGSMS
jgi:hypothetical protein